MTHPNHGRTISEMTPDLPEMEGNPANGLRKAYEQLMQIRDPQELLQQATGIVQSYEGRGVSPQNTRKFTVTLAQQARRGLFAMQKYISDYILKAGGLGVIGVGESAQPIAQLVDDPLEALGSMILEDVNEQDTLAPWQRKFIAVARRHGIHIKVLR